MHVKSFRGLRAWELAMQVVERSFAVADVVRKHRRTSIAAQLERACISIPSNIAEGAGRDSRPEYRHFLAISMGSLRETETLLMIAERLRCAPSPMIELALAGCD